MSEAATGRPDASIEVYIDDAPEPAARFVPPGTFSLDTTALPDGEHELRIVALDVGGHRSIERRRFRVRNGPGIAISGLRDGETIKGIIPVLVNAYAFEKVQHFEVKRAETPVPIPRWYPIAAVAFFAWAAWYLLEYWQVPDQYAVLFATGTVTASPAPAGGGGKGEAVFAANCAACHQAGGTGVPSVFPPLKGDPVVTAADPRPMLAIIRHGLQGKAIDNVAYPGQMPAFDKQLGDQDLADVATYIRSAWGNQAGPVTPADAAGGK